MNIQYFNVFLCRNGEKTNYDLSKLIDKIRVSSPVERTVKLGSQHTMFMIVETLQVAGRVVLLWMV